MDVDAGAVFLDVSLKSLHFLRSISLLLLVFDELALEAGGGGVKGVVGILLLILMVILLLLLRSQVHINLKRSWLLRLADVIPSSFQTSLRLISSMIQCRHPQLKFINNRISLILLGRRKVAVVTDS